MQKLTDSFFRSEVGFSYKISKLKNLCFLLIVLIDCFSVIYFTFFSKFKFSKFVFSMSLLLLAYNTKLAVHHK